MLGMEKKKYLSTNKCCLCFVFPTDLLRQTLSQKPLSCGSISWNQTVTSSVWVTMSWRCLNSTACPEPLIRTCLDLIMRGRPAWSVRSGWTPWALGCQPMARWLWWSLGQKNPVEISHTVFSLSLVRNVLIIIWGLLQLTTIAVNGHLPLWESLAQYNV